MSGGSGTWWPSLLSWPQKCLFFKVAPTRDAMLGLENFHRSPPSPRYKPQTINLQNRHFERMNVDEGGWMDACNGWPSSAILCSKSGHNACIASAKRAIECTTCARNTMRLTPSQSNICSLSSILRTWVQKDLLCKGKQRGLYCQMLCMTKKSHPVSVGMAHIGKVHHNFSPRLLWRSYTHKRTLQREKENLVKGLNHSWNMDNTLNLEYGAIWPYDTFWVHWFFMVFHLSGLSWSSLKDWYDGPRRCVE